MMKTYNAFFPWKPLIYSDKCREITTGRFPVPVTMHIYPTNACNRQCEFCVMKDEQKFHPTQLSGDVFALLIMSANEMGIRCVNLSGGGEPTLYKWLPGIKRFNGLRTITTNGTRLTYAMAKMFHRVRVSLNAGSAETYQKITGCGKDEWQDVTERIASIGKSKRPFVIGIAMVVNADNWEDIPKLCRLAEQWTVDFVHIRPAYYPRASIENIKMQELAPAIVALGQACQAVCSVPVYCITDKFDGYWTKCQYSKCRATPLHVVVTATGELIVCQDVFIRFGDLYKKRLEDIWGSAEHRQALDNIDLATCPRCVMNRANEIIEHIFIKDDVLCDLL